MVVDLYVLGSPYRIGIHHDSRTHRDQYDDTHLILFPHLRNFNFIGILILHLNQIVHYHLLNSNNLRNLLRCKPRYKLHFRVSSLSY